MLPNPEFKWKKQPQIHVWRKQSNDGEVSVKLESYDPNESVTLFEEALRNNEEAVQDSVSATVCCFFSFGFLVDLWCAFSQCVAFQLELFCKLLPLDSSASDPCLVQLSTFVVPSSHNDGHRSGHGNRAGRGGHIESRGGRSELVPVFTVVLEGTLLIFCWDLHEKPSSVVKQVSYLDGTLGVAFIPRSAPHDFGSVTITIEEYA
ncbi:unnamed protein product [Ilex paraguariensis]|uniref:Uncharacterized protein n=1 Tax=Ilex paraguariensis TaxID=185542 RepID=A0ABC8QMS3_9AQUA